jgi:hypothetical protein
MVRALGWRGWDPLKLGKKAGWRLAEIRVAFTGCFTKPS